MSDQSIREALEAVRLDRDDLTAPDLAELSERLSASDEWRQAGQRIQATDAALSAALQDVPVPRGLEERLVAAVAAAEEVSATAAPVETPVVVLPATVEQFVAPPKSRWWTRRRLGVALAVAASLALAAWSIQPWRSVPSIKGDNLGFEALAWLPDAAEFSADMSAAPQQHRPIDRQVRVAAHAWRSLATPYDSQAAVYDLSGRRGAAYLFVLAPPKPSETLQTFASRVPATGGWAAAAWQRGTLVYVLVVDQRRQRLEDYLSPPTSEVVITSRGVNTALVARVVPG